MGTIYDVFAKFDEQNIWIILYFLNRLGRKTGIKSKHLAKTLQKPCREVAGRLGNLEKHGYVKKQLTKESLYALGYPTHWWFISDKGEDLIDSRKKLDTEGHFQTLQQLNRLE